MRLVLAPVFLSLVVLTPSSATAQDAKPDLGANAALKYWTAFSALPPLDKDQEKLLENCNKVPLDAAALKLIDKSERSRTYLHHAAKIERCDWGLNYEEGWRLLLPYVGKGRTLARLAVLHARHELEQGHWKAGAEDVADLLKLARHLETDPMIIPNLIGYTIEAMAIEAAAPYLPELKKVLPDRVSPVLAAPPAGPTLVEMVAFEKKIAADWFIAELKEAERKKKGSWQDIWKEVMHPPESGDQDVPQAKTFAQAIKMLEDSLPYYDQLGKLMTLPAKELETKLPAFFKKAKAESPMAGFMLPAMNRVIHSQGRAHTRLALFKAAVAVVLGGKDKLKDIKDPSGDGPFEYKVLDKGFELKSKLLLNGKPVTLTVGQAKGK
jgi:hypothetical protein